MADPQTMKVCCTRPVGLGLEGGTLLKAADRTNAKGKKVAGPKPGDVVTDVMVGDEVEVPWAVGRLLLSSNAARLIATDHPGQSNPNPEADTPGGSKPGTGSNAPPNPDE